MSRQSERENFIYQMAKLDVPVSVARTILRPTDRRGEAYTDGIGVPA